MMVRLRTDAWKCVNVVECIGMLMRRWRGWRHVPEKYLTMGKLKISKVGF